MASSLAIVLAGLSGVAATGVGVGVASSALRRRATFVRRAHLARDDWALDPLAAPLRTGAASFEVAVWLDAGGLLQVGARRWDRDPGNAIGPRVLRRLAERGSASAGRMFARQRGPVTLMIDILETSMAGCERAYEVLDESLRRYAPLLSRFEDGVMTSGPVTVLVTGATAPRRLMAAQPERFAFVDGTFSDVGVWGAPANLVPVVSESWTSRFGWDGLGEMPGAERLVLQDLVDTAHAEGRRVRFFGLPRQRSGVRERFWGELIGVGVDLITVTSSDVKAFKRRLRRHGSRRHRVTLAERLRDDRRHEPARRAGGAVGARR